MEGTATKQSPTTIKGMKYDIWKLRMLTYMEIKNMNMINIIEKGIPSSG